MGNITVKESVFIAARPEVVYDYTQDWTRRTEWDFSVVSADVIQKEPVQIINVRAWGGMRFTAQYKLNDRPHRTSMAMTDLKQGGFLIRFNYLISGGGGSWKYELENGGTRWTQTNTRVIRNQFLYLVLRPFLYWQLRQVTLKGLAQAKTILETRI